MNELKKWLNDNVLDSKDMLEQEMETLSAHVCSDMEEDDFNPGAKMEIYLYMLEYYYTIMENDEDVKVDSLTFEKPDPEVYELSVQLDNEKQLDIGFFTGEEASDNYRWLDIQRSEEMHENAPSDVRHFMWTEFFDSILLVLADPATRVSSQIFGYLTAESEGEWEREMIQTTAPTVWMALQFVIVEGDGEALLYDEKIGKIEIYPTTTSYERLQRWEEVYNLNSAIPYPEEHIHPEEDWLEISDFYGQHLGTLRDIDDDLPNYISDGSKDDDRTVEEIASGVE